MSSESNAEKGPTESAEAPDSSKPQTNGLDTPEHPKSDEAACASPTEDGHGGHDKQSHSQPHKQPHKRTTEVKDKIVDKKEKIKDKTKPDGGYDPTPLPDFPPGYTVKFTFHKASNLPAADIHTASADPYIAATLTADVPQRHKEDPIMTYRTKTVRRSTEPEWEESWVVANVPSSGFRLKCRLYDEDYPDHDDRLGNFTFETSHIDEGWKGADHQDFEVKKRMGSKRAYILKAATSSLSKNTSMTPLLQLSIEVVGKSDPPGAQMYTVAPARWIKHYSPMIGRITGIKVNKDEENEAGSSNKDERSKKYNFQASELQLQGPVPPKLYHRYVEFRPVIGRMFTSKGLRGRILNKALHKQHRRIYNYDNTTEVGPMEPFSRDAAIQFLRLAHFDEGGRIFTYVLTLDGLMRFTETGKEFGIDLLSKHTMHSNVATYIACSGEFFIRRLKKPTADEEAEPSQPTHPDKPISGGPPNDPPPEDPSYYQLIIDNDSGTYRPDKSVLPCLKSFLEHNFPGLGIVVMHCEDEELTKLKKQQAETKKNEGKTINMVLNRSPSSSSFSSDDEDRLQDLNISDNDVPRRKTKKELALDVMEDPNRIRDLKDRISRGHGHRGTGDAETK